MKEIIRKAIAVMSLSVLLLLPAVMITPQAQAAISDETRSAACEAIGSAGGSCGEGSSGISGLIATIVNILSWIVGVAAVIMIIVGGFRYVTSGGESNAVSAAKNTILYAVVGLIIALLSQGLVRFVLDRSTSSPAPPTNNNAEIRQDGECGIQGGDVC